MNHLWACFVAVFMSLCTSKAQQALKYTLEEELPAGTIVGNIPLDSGLSSKYQESDLKNMTFKFLAQNGLQMEYLSVDSSGILKTRKIIDRDFICFEKTDCVIPADIVVGPQSYLQIIKVRVDILDSNDNQPTFPQSILQLNVSEAKSHGSKFVIPAARDEDAGQYAIQGYELQANSDVFQLQVAQSELGTDVHLILTSRLDRETVGSYQLRIMAFDGGTPRKTGTLIVNIAIIDVNDNDPRFLNDSYEGSISEKAPMYTTILQVKAHDPDAGQNGKVVYAFAARTANAYGTLFGINKDTGVIYLKDSLADKSRAAYHLIVVARDSGVSPTQVRTKVTIKVLDVNDHRPQIMLNLLSTTGVVEISESKPPGSFIAHVSVEDQDTGDNGQIKCSLNNKYFRIHKMYGTNYQIQTATELDRETVTHHSMKLKCVDHGDPPLASSKNIEVTVLDENDHAPQFAEHEYYRHIEENNPVGVFLVQVNASDPDMGKNAEIIYRVEGNSARLVDINPTTGVVTAKISFDHEQTPESQILIVAADHGSPPQSATVTFLLTVIDINDETPTFLQNSYSFGIFENQPANTEVGRVFVSDPDSEPYNEYVLSFSNKDAAFSEVFNLDTRSGRITTKRILDRERKSKYQIQLIATDKAEPRLSSAVNVSVYVADTNDNSPFIKFPNSANNTVFVSNMAPIGYPVTKIQASDNDTGSNARLKYRVRAKEQLFVVDQNTGIITVNKDLVKFGHQVFQLTVQVSDYGTPPKISKTSLNVMLNKSMAIFQTQTAVTFPKLTVIVALAGALAFVLFLLIIVVVVIMKRRESNRERRRQYIGGDHVRMAHGEMEINWKGTELESPPWAQMDKDDFSIGFEQLAQLAAEGKISFDGHLNSLGLPPGAPSQQGQYEVEKYQIRKPEVRDSDSACSADVSNTDSGGNGGLEEERSNTRSRPPDRSNASSLRRGRRRQGSTHSRPGVERHRKHSHHGSSPCDRRPRVSHGYYHDGGSSYTPVRPEPKPSDSSFEKQGDDMNLRSDSPNQYKVALVHPQRNDGEMGDDSEAPSSSYAYWRRGEPDGNHGKEQVNRTPQQQVRQVDIRSDSETSSPPQKYRSRSHANENEDAPCSDIPRHMLTRARAVDLSDNGTASGGSAGDDTDFYEQNEFGGRDIIV